jgi:hypothetical protein
MFQKRKKRLVVLCSWLVLCISQAGSAQYFGNNAFQVPFVGWMGLDNTSESVLDPKNRQPWQATDQLQLGFGYMRTIMHGYHLWYTMQTALGFGYAKENLETSNRVVIGINVSSGLRYNFLEKRHRPFMIGQLEYLQFFNQNPGFGRAFWIGFLFGPGYEWIFANNMGIQIEAGAHFLSDFFNPARMTWTLRLSYMLYF